MRRLAVLAVVLVGLVLWTPRQHASAAIDPTGIWNLTWAGGYVGACGPTTVTLSGSTLTVGPCVPVHDLSGTFDKSTGSISLSGLTDCSGYFNVTFTMSGMVAGDGMSMSGTWASPLCFGGSGTFTGTKKGPLPTTTPTPTITRTPTTTPTVAATSTAPPPTPVEVGGVSRDPTALPPSDGPGGLLAVVTGAALVVVVGGAGGAWYARRRAGR